MAEREGFEPPDPFESTVFKTHLMLMSALQDTLNYMNYQDLQCVVKC